MLLRGCGQRDTSRTMRLRTSVLLVVAELAAALVLAAAPSPAGAQFFDFFGGGGRGGRPSGMLPSMPSIPFFDQPRRSHTQQRGASGGQQGDYSRAPAPAKADKASPPDLKTIVVMGDSMADWLANGLEQAYADTPE